MFLDDELYQKFINTNIQSTNDFNVMVGELYVICQNHIAKRISIGDTSFIEASTLMEKSFNSWALFVERIQKEKLPFAHLLKKEQFQDDWMNNEDLRNLYLKGK